MPIKLNYHPDEEYLVCTGTNPLTVEEFRRAMETILTSKDFPPDIRTVWDCRKFDFREIDRKFEERLIEVRKKLPERGRARLALVVSDDLGFGMIRMYEILSEELPQQTRAFRDYDEGVAWLVSEE